jgi:hypothetical protein
VTGKNVVYCCAIGMRLVRLFPDAKFVGLRFFLEQKVVHSRHEIKKRQEERKAVVGVPCGFDCECAPWEIVWVIEYGVPAETEGTKEHGATAT